MSSSDMAITVRGLSKVYKIAHQGAHTTLGEAFMARLRHPFRRSGSSEQFWALRDVDFDVKQGEVIGVIGRNGAGKSTLLKILSRITEPTKGRIELFGRVGSLLEVGTGFHPELTGRENIFLNGSILGMRTREIERQFDAIVDFAGVEQFLDTPVKRYSSGMYVRLAFAVAAHLNPEILVVDEVLSVGDGEFQKKCLGKMKDVATSGRTVLFVSHNMAAVSNLCTSCIVMDAGKLSFQGPTDQGIDRYLSLNAPDKDQQRDMARFRPSWAKEFIIDARMLGPGGREQYNFPMGSDLTIEMSFRCPDNRQLRRPVMGVVINHTTLGVVGGVNMRMTGFELNDGPYASATLSCTLSHLPLLQGRYTVELWLGDGPEDVDCLINFLAFHIEPADVYGSGQTPFGHLGAIYLDPQWRVSSNRFESLPHHRVAMTHGQASALATTSES